MPRLFRTSLVCVFLMFFCALFVSAKNDVLYIRVNSQEDFDKVTKSIDRGIQDGYSTIRVVFAKQVYYYKDAQINIGNKNCPDISLEIIGNNAIFRPVGTLMPQKGAKAAYKNGCSYLDVDGNDIYNYSKTYQADTLIEVLDDKAKTCRLYNEELKGMEGVDCTNAKIEITTWYTRLTCNVQKFQDGYVYFVADKLEPGMGRYGNYNVNYDYTVCKLYPRFRFSGLSIDGCPFASDGASLVSRLDKPVYQCEESLFLQVIHSTFKSVSMRDIKVQGNTSACPLIIFNDNKVQSISVNNSEFSSIRAISIYGKATDNITVENCYFHDNYAICVMCENNCANSRVSYNKFERIGYLTNGFCIRVHGSNYQVDHNEISDFGYGAIAVGVTYMNTDQISPSYGVVERNHIYHTSAFKANKASWTLEDSGAIYLFTRNDGAVVRYNYVHGIAGMHDNRGIYCDDGTTNCSVYGNIVMDIENSYGIDLRKSLTLDNIKSGRSNVNNTIYDNIINNKLRFEGRGDDSSSHKGANLIVVGSDGEVPMMVTSSLVEDGADKIVKYSTRKIERKAKRMLRKK